MRSRRGSRRSRSSRSVPSRKVWGGWITVNAVNGAPQTGTLDNNSFSSHWILSPNDASDFYDEPTVLRMLFRCGVIAGEASGSDNTEAWYNLVGVAIWVTPPDDEDTSVPPFINMLDTTKQYLWLAYYQFGHEPNDILRFNTVPAADGPGELKDLRGKRKIPEGSGLAFQIQNFDETAAAGDRLQPIRWFSTGRYLMGDH